VRRLRLLGLGLVLVAVGPLTSCVRVPTEGPVVETRGHEQAEPSQAPYNNPPPPRPGASPVDVVSGFLDAMTATPLQTNRAAEFLTQRGRAQWDPQRVVTYGGREPQSHGHDVVLRMRGVYEIGADGRWQGRGSPAASRITLPMAKEDGQWRIAKAPDALIVPRIFYDQNFQDATLYYFDPSGRILVPEPVHVPQGSQLASSLVRLLLRGPRQSSSPVSRTFIPRGLSVGLSVPVNHGLAEVNLKGPVPGPLDANDTRRMIAQFGWTLRQDPSITAFTLSIAGRTITTATGQSKFPVSSADSDGYDPAGERSSGQTYALRRGRLVSGQVDHLTRVNGPFGNEALGIGSFAVSMDGLEVAAVGPDALLEGPVLGDSQPTPVLTGPGLLRPSWDFANRLWEVQDGPTGARVVYLSKGRRHVVRAPGITHEQVRRFLVSRDGSRLVAIVRGPSADRIVVSRIRYDADGAATHTTRARVIPWQSAGTTRIRDIGWTSPTTIAVLDQVSRTQAEVRILNIDGSTVPDESQPDVITGRVSGLATSPVANLTPYAVQQDILTDVSPVDFGKPVPISGLRHITYAG